MRRRMSWPTPVQLDQLVADFHAATLPASAWTHATHLAVGTWHIRHYGAAAALPRLRSGIRRLNDAHGTANTDSGGYHETVTRAYVCLIAEFLAAWPPEAATAECVRALLASPLAVRGALLAYYSSDRLMSVAARRDWVEPDLRFLPALVAPSAG